MKFNTFNITIDEFELNKPFYIEQMKLGNIVKTVHIIDGRTVLVTKDLRLC